MSENPSVFYERLLDEYHLMFPDWFSNLAALTKPTLDLVKNHSTNIETILDASCGVGTHALALAASGYKVHAVDVKAEVLDTLNQESSDHGLEVTSQVGDLRTLSVDVIGQFDCVVCFNGFPHLQTDRELFAACQETKSKLKPGGLLIASMRDYDAMLVDRSSGYAPRPKPGLNGERITFQMWEWIDDNAGKVVNGEEIEMQPGTPELHKVRYFTLDKAGIDWKVRESVSVYRPLKRASLSKALEHADFKDIKWLLPAETGFEQPIVIAKS